VSVLVVSWMVAVPLASSPYPSLANAASHSTIVRGVDAVMPSDLRTLYARLRTFLDRSGFPPVFGDLPTTSIVNVPPPDPNLSPALRAALLRDEPSILKVYGQAASCSRGIEGSGFVVGPNRMVTNAHVVAGTDHVAVALPDGRNITAHVVVYDPQRDVAVLDVPGLTAAPLRFATATAVSGAPAVVAGYPEDGPFTSRSARVRDLRTVSGANIYGNGDVRRELYVIRGVVQSGNSGGPLLASDGSVLGIVFAKDLRSSETGYVLSAHEVASDVSAGMHATASVSTGGCTPE
jgi:S1-C subfamily serine protease